MNAFHLTLHTFHSEKIRKHMHLVTCSSDVCHIQLTKRSYKLLPHFPVLVQILIVLEWTIQNFEST